MENDGKIKPLIEFIGDSGEDGGLMGFNDLAKENIGLQDMLKTGKMNALKKVS